MRVKANPQLNMLALASRTQPRPAELTSARLHRFTVKRRLARSFDVRRLTPIGSHARGTANRWYSDLDILVVLRRNEAKWGGRIVSSRTLVSKVIEDLQARFTNTKIRRDQHAIVVSFAAGQQSLDIVPATFLQFASGRPVYAIPDGYGGWLEVCPEAHNRYFSVVVERSGGKLKKLVQLLRWWKFSRVQAIPIQSFYIDMLIATSNIAIGVKPYTHCLYQAFQLLVDRECRGLRDPVGVAGIIKAGRTEFQRETILGAATYALTHARAAVAAQAVRDFEEANRQWSIVFNGTF